MPVDHFGLIARFYAHADEFNECTEVIRLLDLSEADRLLDAGGGTGRVAAALGAKVRQTVIADPSVKMLKYAHAKKFVTVCTPAETLPFPDNSFDKIIMVDAFHHVNDQSVSARELWRVLHSGGKLLILEPDIHKFTIRLLALSEKALFMRSHFLAFENIQKLFEEMSARVTVQSSNNNAMILVQKVRQM
jgi:ubiquinone/menaquinone biosynthesis C-methylase UbiE